MTTTPDTGTRLRELAELVGGATDAPWQWLDSGGDPGEYDELQDGNGEMVASGFRDDLNLDGPGRVTDGRLCAALRNAAPELLEALRRAEVAERALGDIRDMEPETDPEFLERACPACGAAVAPSDTHWNLMTDAYECPVPATPEPPDGTRPDYALDDEDEPGYSETGDDRAHYRDCPGGAGCRCAEPGEALRLALNALPRQAIPDNGNIGRHQAGRWRNNSGHVEVIGLAAALAATPDVPAADLDAVTHRASALWQAREQARLTKEEHE